MISATYFQMIQKNCTNSETERDDDTVERVKNKTNMVK